MHEVRLKIRGADYNTLVALLDLVSDYRKVNIRLFKPRLSRTYEITIQGSQAAVEAANTDISKFAARAGWRVEAG